MAKHFTKKSKTIYRFTKGLKQKTVKKLKSFLRHPLPFLWFIFLVLVLVFRYSVAKPVYQEGQKVRISGRIINEPQKTIIQQKFKLQNLNIKLYNTEEINYGDKVVVEGTVEDKNLAKAKLIKIEKTENFLYVFRQKIISFYQSTLPEPHACLVGGMIIGSKANIPYQFWSDLKLTGTAHLVVASGTNVSFVAGFLMAFLLVLVKRRLAIVLTFIGIGFYVVLSGLDAPIVRASLMAFIALTAQELGRTSVSIRALFYSAYVMLLINPFWLTDLGFILSFSATLGLILFQKRFDNWLIRVPGFIRTDLTTTLAASVFVVPILAFMFGQFNPFTPIINVLVLWTVAPIMIIGSLGGVIGLIIPFVGRFILYLVYPLTWWFSAVVNLAPK